MIRDYFVFFFYLEIKIYYVSSICLLKINDKHDKVTGFYFKDQAINIYNLYSNTKTEHKMIENLFHIVLQQNG